MLSLLTPLYLIFFYVSLPNEIKLLLFNTFFFAHAMLINSFDFCQPITDVYIGLLTNERARF